MIGYEYALENDETLDGIESEEFENDENDEMDERRPRFGRRPRITAGRTATGRGLFKPRPSTQPYVTQAQFEAGMSRVGKQIQTNGESIKKVAAQATRVSSDLTSATTRLDKQVGDLKKEVKKQAEMGLLMMLLQKPAPIKTLTVPHPTEAGKTVDVTVSKTEYDKHNNMLLPMLMMSGGSMGGDNNNMMLLALALSGSL